jgi:3-phosphoshikimate 1-carboxyvinyltransferase
MPIRLSGRLTPGEYKLPGDISSQFVSGLLFALPLLDGPSKIIITSRLESLPYVRMTLAALHDFGINISASPDYMSFEIPGGQSYRAVSDYIVEGDWSQAAFFCVMGALNGNIRIDGLKLESLQGDKAILDILKDMGAVFYSDNDGIIFEKSMLHGVEIDVSQCPDLVPAISVAASAAKGPSRIKNAARLRIKESDRLSAVHRELGALGADIEEEPDGLIIHGRPELAGGYASGSGDHRIVMALASLSAVCKQSVEIEGSESVKKSYPEFWEDFISIGGRIESI